MLLKMKLKILALVVVVDVAMSACPVEDDPSNLARCIQLDTAALVGVVRGSNDMTPVCAMADRYMECVKTYTRGCMGFFVILLSSCSLRLLYPY